MQSALKKPNENSFCSGDVLSALPQFRDSGLSEPGDVVVKLLKRGILKPVVDLGVNFFEIIVNAHRRKRLMLAPPNGPGQRPGAHLAFEFCADVLGGGSVECQVRPYLLGRM